MLFLSLKKKRLGGDCRCVDHPTATRFFGGPPQQGAVGLPNGANKGITGAYSLTGRIAFRGVPHIGAAQFGGQPMGAQRLVMGK